VLWQPNFAVPRFYEVEVFVPNNHATSWQAGFLVHSPADVQRTVVDQQGTSDYWLSLGHHFLREGDNPWGAVKVHDDTGENDYTRKLGVDAVRFTPLRPVFQPLTMNNRY
jgi:hypothetical protein